MPEARARLAGSRIRRQAGIILLSAAVAFALGALVMRLAGLHPGVAYLALARGGAGSWPALSETLLRFAPLALSALAVVAGFRAGFFTIGVEGQFYLGALAATVTALALPAWPPPLALAAALLTGMLAGAAWALVAGLLRLRLGVNEVIGTLMLNYIALLLVDYLLRGPIRAAGSDLQYTALIPAHATFARIVPSARLTWAVAVPLVGAAGVAWFFERTWSGYCARTYQANPVAARFAGISASRAVLPAVAISGALAGLAGTVVILGEFHRLQAGLGGDYGFTAIPVALVGGLRTVPTLVASLFFSALTVGATMMQLKAAVPYPMVRVLEGLVVLCAVGGQGLPGIRHRLRLRAARKARTAEGRA